MKISRFRRSAAGRPGPEDPAIQRRAFVVAGLAAVVVTLAIAPGAAQTVTQRGFVEGRVIVYPQEAPNDATRAIADLLVREELFVKPAPWLQFAAGADIRGNTYDQVEGSWHVDLTDRRRLRPALSVRRLNATLTHGPFTLDLGKQFIRWGTTDIVTPTDRFAPRDFLNVVNDELMAVSGARGVVQVGGNRIDAVWVPSFTPSRAPLLNQRWTVTPPAAAALTFNEVGAAMPSRSQAGIRWGHVGSGIDYSVSFFDGFNHLPNLERVASPSPFRVDFVRRYPSLRMYGADAALPTPWLTLKGETAYFTSSTPGTDEYVLYVIQVERQAGEWVFVGGYAGEVVTARRAALTFAPDRGLTRAFVGRASYTIDPNRSVAVEGAVRQNGHGAVAKAELSQAHGQHWRTTVVGIVIRGDGDDFLGQYRRNSNVSLALRYSY